MFRCDKIERNASDYIDQQVSWWHRITFRFHLFICRNCRNYIRQLRTTVASLKLLKAEPKTKLTEEQQKLAEKLRKQALKH